MRIERLKLADWEEFYSCFEEILKEDFVGYPKQAKEALANQAKLKRAFTKRKRVFWVAKVKKRIVGFLIVIGSADGMSFVNWLGVKREFRRQGIGRKLIENWQAWAKKRGYHKLLSVTSIKGNQAFYEKSGFSLEGIKRKDSYGLDRFIFGKIIGKYEASPGRDN